MITDRLNGRGRVCLAHMGGCSEHKDTRRRVVAGRFVRHTGSKGQEQEKLKAEAELCRPLKERRSLDFAMKREKNPVK